MDDDAWYRGMAVAAFALQVATLKALVDVKVLKSTDAREIIDTALLHLEVKDAAISPQHQTMNAQLDLTWKERGQLNQENPAELGQMRPPCDALPERDQSVRQVLRDYRCPPHQRTCRPGANRNMRRVTGASHSATIGVATHTMEDSLWPIT